MSIALKFAQLMDFLEGSTIYVETRKDYNIDFGLSFMFGMT